MTASHFGPGTPTSSCPTCQTRTKPATIQTNKSDQVTVTTKIFCYIEMLSSRGGLEVEQWSDNITLSISVDQSPLGACILYGTNGPAMFSTS